VLVKGEETGTLYAVVLALYQTPLVAMCLPDPEGSGNPVAYSGAFYSAEAHAAGQSFAAYAAGVYPGHPEAGDVHSLC